MAMRLLPGPRVMSLQRTAKGHRIIPVVWLAESDDPKNDGPIRAMLTPGLPLPGSFWFFGNDLDMWAWCRGDLKVSREQAIEGDPERFWRLEQIFSTEPPDEDQEQCSSSDFGDPLTAPQKISGGFNNAVEEATHDRFGNPIVNPAGEQMRGPQVEFEKSRPMVRIEQNVPDLQLSLLYTMANTVNDAPLWGFPKRCIKLAGPPWERKFYGTCYVYYTRTLEFEVNAKLDPDTGLIISGWDRSLLAEGTKLLSGYWDDATGLWTLKNVGGAAPNSANPTHYNVAVDREGNPMRVVYDKNRPGQPYEPNVAGSEPAEIEVEYHQESNFLILGIPTDF